MKISKGGLADLGLFNSKKQPAISAASHGIVPRAAGRQAFGGVAVIRWWDFQSRADAKPLGPRLRFNLEKH